MEEQARAEFESSSGGFLLNWPYVWSAAQTDVKDGTKPSSLLSDIGWARYPQVIAGHASAPPYGGIDLGISHYSKHQSLDLQAAECITSAANQAQYMIASGNPAAKASAYDDPAVQKAFPMASVIRDSINAAGPRAQSPFYTDISGSLLQTWSPPTGVNPELDARQRGEPDDQGAARQGAAVTALRTHDDIQRRYV